MHFLFGRRATWRPAAEGCLIPEIADAFANMAQIGPKSSSNPDAQLSRLPFNSVSCPTRKTRTLYYHGFRGFHGCKNTEIPIREISAIRGSSS
jgi:hypothetical protein